MSKPDTCNLPNTLPAREARIYKILRASHCAQKRPAHDCQGRLIIDKNGITASCPLCGDARSVNPR